MSKLHQISVSLTQGQKGKISQSVSKQGGCLHSFKTQCFKW